MASVHFGRNCSYANPHARRCCRSNLRVGVLINEVGSVDLDSQFINAQQAGRGGGVGLGIHPHVEASASAACMQAGSRRMQRRLWVQWWPMLAHVPRPPSRLLHVCVHQGRAAPIVSSSSLVQCHSMHA